MQISKDTTKIPFRIRSYEPGKVVINDQILTSSVIISKISLIQDWSPQQVSDLSIACFDKLLACQAKLILFGTGEKQHFPHPSLYANLLTHGITIEFMNTKAACHTFNVLMSEDRDVACALLL